LLPVTCYRISLLIFAWSPEISQIKVFFKMQKNVDISYPQAETPKLMR